MPDAIAAWVAVESDEVVGHVALRPGHTGAMTDLATEKTGIPMSRFGVVARLRGLSARSPIGHRPIPFGSRGGSCYALGLRPILDVVDSHVPAIRLYESLGWTCLGEITVTFGPGVPVDEFVFIAPGPDVA